PAGGALRPGVSIPSRKNSIRSRGGGRAGSLRDAPQLGKHCRGAVWTVGFGRLAPDSGQSLSNRREKIYLKEQVRNRNRGGLGTYAGAPVGPVPFGSVAWLPRRPKT